MHFYSSMVIAIVDNAAAVSADADAAAAADDEIVGVAVSYLIRCHHRYPHRHHYYLYS